MVRGLIHKLLKAAALSLGFFGNHATRPGLSGRLCDPPLPRRWMASLGRMYACARCVHPADHAVAQLSRPYRFGAVRWGWLTEARCKAQPPGFGTPATKLASLLVKSSRRNWWTAVPISTSAAWNSILSARSVCGTCVTIAIANAAATTTALRGTPCDWAPTACRVNSAGKARYQRQPHNGFCRRDTALHLIGDAVLVLNGKITRAIAGMSG